MTKLIYAYHKKFDVIIWNIFMRCIKTKIYWLVKALQRFINVMPFRKLAQICKTFTLWSCATTVTRNWTNVAIAVARMRAFEDIQDVDRKSGRSLCYSGFSYLPFYANDQCGVGRRSDDNEWCRKNATDSKPMRSKN